MSCATPGDVEKATSLSEEARRGGLRCQPDESPGGEVAYVMKPGRDLAEAAADARVRAGVADMPGPSPGRRSGKPPPPPPPRVMERWWLALLFLRNDKPELDSAF